MDHVLIQQLCEELLGAQSDAEIYSLAEQLRAAIREHIEKVRLAVREMPVSGGSFEQ